MQGLRSALSDLECKDKFLIQSTVVDSGTREEDVTLDLFSKSSGKYVEEKKLRVILMSKQDSLAEEHNNKVLEPEPSNEALTKEKKLVKRDENVSPKHVKNEDVSEVKSALTAEDPKPFGDLDGNDRNLSKNTKLIPVKEVKEDPEKKFRLSNQLKELKLKENALENQLKEAKSTISSLTYQNSIIIEAKETLQLEVARRSKKGFSFVFVCLVSFIGVIVGYLLLP